MSYIRWSSDIKNVVPWEEEVRLYKEGKHYADVKKLREERGAELSKWYIFWHTNYLDDVAVEQTRADQLLSVWYVGAEDTPTLPYDDIKRLYEEDSFESIFDVEIEQKEVMRDCVRRWLEEVEEEYHS